MKKCMIVLMLILVFSFSSFAEGEDTSVGEIAKNVEDPMVGEITENVEDPMVGEIAENAEDPTVGEIAENVEDKTEITIDKVQDTVPSINFLDLLKKVNPASAKDGKDVYLDTTLNYPGFSRAGMGFGKFYNGFGIDLGLNALVSVIMKDNFGLAANIKISVGTGEFAFMAGGCYILREKDNTVLIIDAGPSVVLSQGYFQIGLDLIASYNYFLTSNWYAKAGGELNIVFFDTVNKGGFSFGFVLPSIGLGYKF